MSISTTGTLSPDQFNQYAAQWASTIVNAETTVLTTAFKSGGNRVLHARFPMDALTSLLSTVGVHQIKVRFLLIPTVEPIGLQFALALFAANVLNERVSGYYLVDTLVTTTPQLPEQPGGIPTALAAEWLEHWQVAAQVSPALFTTSAGPLQGYNFTVADFLAPLRAYATFTDLELQFGFGLHKYVAPAASETLTQTFGLLLRVYNAQQQVGSGLENMGTPCPPMH